MSFPCPDRVRIALKGNSREVLRIIALQPVKPSTNPPEPTAIPVPGR